MKTYNEYIKGEDKATFEAVWTYLLDHAEITNEGTLFVKFHCKSKESFKKRILARMKGVHRHPSWAESLIAERRENVLEHSLMQSALAQVKKENEIRIKLSLFKRLKKWLKIS